MYDILYSEKAIKQLEKLEKQVRERIILSLERSRIRPYANIKKLVGNPFFSLRVGDYRVILSIENNELKILVVEIGHRRNIYQH